MKVNNEATEKQVMKNPRSLVFIDLHVLVINEITLVIH